MSLGTGIFASTVLLLCAAALWLITTHKKWKLVGKIAGSIVALCVVVAGGVYAWLSYEPPLSVVTELAGVKLGMSPAAVTLAKGPPTSISEPSIDGSQTKIDYGYSDVTISFYGPDKFATKAEIICEHDGYSRLLGFGRYSSEDEITDKLGNPDSTSISSSGLSKFISYSKWKATFEISKRAVSKLCIHTAAAISFSQELLTPDEQRAAEERAAQQRAAEQRAAEGRVAQQRAAEQRAAEERKAEERAAEERKAEERKAEELAAAYRAAEQRLSGDDLRGIIAGGKSQAVYRLAKKYQSGIGVPRDLLRAYMWMSFDPGFFWLMPSLEVELSPAEIAQAQEMARKCRASNFKQCD